MSPSSPSINCGDATGSIEAKSEMRVRLLTPLFVLFLTRPLVERPCAIRENSGGESRLGRHRGGEACFRNSGTLGVSSKQSLIGGTETD